MASNRKGRSVSTEGLFFYLSHSIPRYKSAVKKQFFRNCDIDHNLRDYSTKKTRKPGNNLVTFGFGHQAGFRLE